MAGLALQDPAAVTKRLDLAPQRAAFAAEFIDPVSGRLVGDGLSVKADGFGPPTLTPSNRFVWLHRGEPDERRIRLEAVAADKRFAPFAQEIDLPAHQPDRPPAAALIFRRRLIPTGLYQPPPGMIAVGGMLVEDGESKAPVAGAKVRIHFRHAEGLELFRGGYTAFTDDKGGFTAVVRRLRDVRPDMDVRSPGSFEAWLSLTQGSDVRVSPILSLRLGRMIRIPQLLKWAALPPPASHQVE